MALGGAGEHSGVHIQYINLVVHGPFVKAGKHLVLRLFQK